MTTRKDVDDTLIPGPAMRAGRNIIPILATIACALSALWAFALTAGRTSASAEGRIRAIEQKNVEQDQRQDVFEQFFREHAKWDQASQADTRERLARIEGLLQQGKP